MFSGELGSQQLRPELLNLSFLQVGCSHSCCPVLCVSGVHLLFSMVFLRCILSLAPEFQQPCAKALEEVIRQLGVKA